MIYKLTEKNLTTRKQRNFEINFEIKDFCCVGDNLFFLHDDGIGKMNNGDCNPDWRYELTYTEKPDFSTFSSICYNSSYDCLYIVSEGGSRIHKVDLELMDFENLISKNSAKQFRRKVLGRSDSRTYVTSLENQVIWSTTNCHRCFIMNEENAFPLIGCGKAGFSISNLKNTRISKPTGVAIMGKTVCFADSGNNCLRGIRKNSTYTIIDDCKDLKDIYYVKNKLFFLSDNTVHMLSSEGDATHLFEIYKVGNKILTFCPSDNGCVYILEEYYVESPEEAESY